MGGEQREKLLVVSDDALLGDLVALNLRQRGYAATYVDLALARLDQWSPPFGAPDLVILDLEAGEQVAPDVLRQLAAREWLGQAPLILAVEHAGVIAKSLGRRVDALARPADVGGILAAARALLSRGASTT